MPIGDLHFDRKIGSWSKVNDVLIWSTFLKLHFLCTYLLFCCKNTKPTHFLIARSKTFALSYTITGSKIDRPYKSRSDCVGLKAFLPLIVLNYKVQLWIWKKYFSTNNVKFDFPAYIIFYQSIDHLTRYAFSIINFQNGIFNINFDTLI